MNFTCFSSVIFPENLKYFRPFLNSLKNQTDKKFTLLLFNDGVTNLKSYMKSFDLTYETIPVTGSIGNIREQMLSYIKKSKYTYTVFGDTDDYFPENRVAINKLILQNQQIVINDLCLVSEDESIIKKKYWEGRLELKQQISLDSILNYNFFGLGNTAIRNDILPENLFFDKRIIAVDWLLFSRILREPKAICFTSDTYIYYRQHDNNCVGRKEPTLQEFNRIFQVKLSHYTVLALENESFKVLAKQYQKFAKEVKDISQNEIFNYAINNKHPFWWEEIQL
jgi:hypothetical protein